MGQDAQAGGPAVKHTRGGSRSPLGLSARVIPAMVAVVPLLSSCATIEAVQAYPEATWALLEAVVSDILSIFTFFL